MTEKRRTKPLDPNAPDAESASQQAPRLVSSYKKRTLLAPRRGESNGERLSGEARKSHPARVSAEDTSAKTLWLSGSHHREKSRWIVNARFLVVSLVAVPLVGLVAYFWHQSRVKQQVHYYLDRAAAAEKEEKWGDAANAIRDYLRLRPDDIPARVRLAKTYDRSAVAVKDKYRATTYYYHALGLSPDEVELRRRLAELLVELGGFPPAEKEARRLLDIDSHDAVGRRVLALCRWDRWRTEGKPIAGAAEVIDALNRALEAKPGDIELSCKLAEAYRDELTASSEAVRRRLADAVMDRMVQVDLNRAEARLARYQYRQRYHVADADQDLARALELAPDDVDVLVAAGMRAEEQEHFRDAQEYYQKVIKLAPKDRRGYEGLGNTFKAQEDLARAIEAWRDGLLSAGLEDVELNAALADALIELRRLEEAGDAVRRITRVARSLTVDVSRPYRTRVRGLVAMLTAKLALANGNPLEGLEELKTAAAAQQIGAETPQDLVEHYHARMRLGWVYRLLGQWDLAAVEFERAAALMPREAQARAALAGAWRSAERLDLAVRHYQQALELDPDSKLIRIALAECNFQQQFSVAEDRRDWEPLREVLKETKQRFPDTVSVQLLEAVFEEAQGRPEQALALLQKAVEADPASLRLVQSLILACEQRGDHQAADQTLAQYEKLSGEPSWLLRAELHAQRQEFDDAKRVLRTAVESLSGPQRHSALRRLVELGLDPGEFAQLRSALAKEVEQSSRPDLRLVEQLAQFALQSDDFTGLAHWEERLKGLEGDRGSLWRYYRGRRLVAESKGINEPELVEATQLQAELEGMRPSWASTYLLKGQIAQKQGWIDPAAEAYQRAVELGENHISVFEQLIGVLYRQNRFVDADQFLQRLTRHIAGSQDLSAMALSIASRRGQLSRTLELAQDGVKQRPDDAMAHVWLGIALMLAGRAEEAEVTFYRAVKMAPKDARAWTALAAFHVQKNEPQSAREAIEGLAKNANLTEGKRSFVLAQGYEVIGDRDQAELLYREAVRDAPQDVLVQQRAAVFFLTASPGEAEACFRRILAVAPQDATTRQKLAMLLVARGGSENLQEAWKLLGGTSGQGAAPAVARRLQALLLLRLGDARSRRQAQDILESLLRDSDDPGADDRLILATLYEDQGRARAAREQLATLASRRQPKPAHLAAYVDYLLHHDSPKDAAVWVARLKEVEPDSFRTLLLQSRLLKQQGRAAEVEPLVETFLKNKPNTPQGKSERAQLLEQAANLCAEVGLSAAAERYYRQLVELTPAGYKPLATWLAQCGRRAEAIQCCMAAAQEGKSVEATVALCAVLAEMPQAEYDRSLTDKVVRAALLQYPTNEHLLFYAATLRHMEGDQAEAGRLYRELLAINPRHVQALNNLAALLSEDAAQREEAQGLIDRAMEIAGGTTPLLDTQAVLWIHQGKLPQAIELLQELSGRAKADPRYHFHLALAYRRSGAVREAKAAVERAQAAKLRSQSLTPVERILWNELLDVLGKKPTAGSASASKVAA